MSTPTDHPPVLAQRMSAAVRHLVGRGWRKMTWVLIAWSAFIVVWAAASAGYDDSTTTSSCQSVALGYGAPCDQLGSQNAAAQFEHAMKIGVVGFAILSIISFMSRQQDK